MIALQIEWYARLKATGFEDIEDTRTEERPLKKWTCLIVGDIVSQKELEPMGSSFPEPKFKNDEELLNHPDFVRVCESLGKHQNNSMTPDEIGIVWSMHCNGLSNRQIAKELGNNERSIRRVMKKIVIWRNLL